MINEPAHTASKKRMVPGMPKINFASERAPNNELLKSEVALRFIFSYGPPITVVREVSLQSVHLVQKIQTFTVIASHEVVNTTTGKPYHTIGFIVSNS